MKKPGYLGLLGTLISLAMSCSPRVYSGQLVVPAAAQAQPMLASATATTPLTDSAARPLAHLASATPALAQPTPVAQLALGKNIRAVRKSFTKDPIYLNNKLLSHSLALSPPRGGAEVAGTQTGAERLEKLAILLVLFFVFLGFLFTLLVKAVVRLLHNRNFTR